MKTTKQKLVFFKISWSCALLYGFFIFRDAVLQQTLDKISNEMTVDYNSTFTVKRFFDGLSGLNLSEITLVPKNADTLFKIKLKQASTCGSYLQEMCSWEL
jgi:hypothetical protein